MFGAVIGDIIGRPYVNKKIDDSEKIQRLNKFSTFTEISVMTLAVAEALMRAMPVCPADGGKICVGSSFQKSLIASMKQFGKKFSKIHYGKKFNAWIHKKNPTPYESLSNGAALRVSPVAWAFDNILDVERFAELVARVTTPTAETVKFTRTFAGMVFLARMKKEKSEIKDYFEKRAEIKFSATIEEIRPDFTFSSKCNETISAAFAAFLESENFGETMTKAISLGGETTATASMSGALAEAYFGTSISTEAETFDRLHKYLKFVVGKFEQWKRQ